MPAYLVSAEAMSDLGYEVTQATAVDFPKLDPLPGVQPVQLSPAGDIAESWERQTTTPNGRLVERYQISSDRRVLATDSQTIGDDGTVIGERHDRFGDLAVYRIEDVPDSVFELVEMTEERCS